MATYTVPNGVIVTDYDPTTGTLIFEGQLASGFTISDGNPATDNQFTTSENLTFQSLGGGSPQPASYLGTLPFNGDFYPIFEIPNAIYVVGAEVGGTYPTTGDFFASTAPFTVCFGEGTRIATVDGHCAVEDLAIGDSLRRADGGAVAVKWIGRQTVSTRFGPAERLMPVRFAAGSLGDGLPQTDLTVTADHGMLVDGVICHAGALVNGTTITRVPLAEMGDSYTVYHVETEDHEIILANGAPAETFIDNVSRRVFDNYAEFEALYGEVPEMEELPYPRAMSARQVPASIRAKLAGKAAA